MSRRLPIWLRPIAARPRLVISCLVGVAALLCLPESLALHRITRLIIG